MASPGLYPMKQPLVLYFRSGCSLCEAMIDELLPYQTRLGFDVSYVDVDSEEALARRYGERVPLLVGTDEHVICEFFLDPAALDRYFLG